MKLLAIAALGALLGAAPSPAPSASPAPAATVHIKDFAYHAPSVTIHPGDSVRFVNDDGEAHTVTLTDKSVDSGGLDQKDAWVHTFAKAGTYTYFCALHPYMKGTVIVAPVAVKSDAQ